MELARARPEVVCLSGDLTRQCEVDLFQEEFPGRFIHAGMAEANMIGVAGALARQGLMPFVHSFGVFVTRRPLDQIVNAVAYPRLPVRIVGFMPGVSSPGGPSHQAIEDIALMRAIPGMTVIDVADATETAQVVAAMADVPGPVYLRLKRGEIPVIFPGDHRLSLDRAQVLEWRGEAMDGGAQTTGGAGTDGGGVTSGGAQIAGGADTSGGAHIAGLADTVGGGVSTGGGVTSGGAHIAGLADTVGGGVSAGGGVSSGGAGITDGGWTSGHSPSSDVALLVSGMMVAPALAAARVLRAAGAVTVVVNVPVIKPLDTATVLAVATRSTAVVTAENHTIIGGLGSAVAEALAEAGLGRPLRRIGLADTFAEGARDAQYLFTKYGLSTQHIVDTAWSVLDRPGSSPRVPPLPAHVGEYRPCRAAGQAAKARLVRDTEEEIMVQNYDATAQSVAIASPGATLGTDWEQRVDFARLRGDRARKVQEALDRSELGSLILFDMNNIRYATATHIGNWARDKLFRCCLVMRGEGPILWDIGSAARTHQMLRALERQGELAGRYFQLARIHSRGGRGGAGERPAASRYPARSRPGW